MPLVVVFFATFFVTSSAEFLPDFGAEVLGELGAVDQGFGNAGRVTVASQPVPLVVVEQTDYLVQFKVTC